MHTMILMISIINRNIENIKYFVYYCRIAKPMNYKTIRFISLEEVTEHPLKPVTIMVNV